MANFKKVILFVAVFMLFAVAVPAKAAGTENDWICNTTSNWNNTACWSLSHQPTSTEDATFTSAHTGSATINVALSAGTAPQGIVINTGYTGTITQGSGNAITVGVDGWTQADGTFTGGNSNITTSGDFILSGGAVTTTSATWTFLYTIAGGTNSWTHTAGTFTATTGTVVFDFWSGGVGGATRNITVPTSETFNNLTFMGSWYYIADNIINGNTLIVLGTFSYLGNNALSTQGLNTGIVEVRGNMVIGTEPGVGTATIKFLVSGNQTITRDSSDTFGSVCHILINKPSGTVTLAGTQTDFRTNNLTINSGSLDLNGKTLTVDGTFSMGGGTLIGSNLTLAKNIALTADSTVQVGSPNNFTLSGIISGAYSLSKTGTGNLILNNNNTFSQGVKIKAGYLSLASNVNAAGSGTITLGDTSGSANATLQLALNNFTIPNSITVASGSSGTLTIGNGGLWVNGFTGPITLNHDVTLSANDNFAVTGNISGTGNITLNCTASNCGGILGSASINMVGTITNSSSASTIGIGGAIGSNVTGIIQNSATSALTISGAINVNASGTTLTNSVGTLTVTGGSTGTGNLIINTNNNSATTTIGSTGTLNNTGTITNSGTSTAGTTISAVIGANVTGVIQNSATSSLSLSGNNANFAGGVTIKSGTVSTVYGQGNAKVFGTGTITIGDTSGSNNATLQGHTLTFSNPITVAAGSSGTLAIRNGASEYATLSGAITLNNNVTLAGGGAGGILYITGGITGTGNIITSTAGSGAVQITTTAINNIGTITSLGTSTAGTTISAAIGINVTGITQNSVASPMALSNAANTFTGLVTNSAGTLYITQNNTFSTVTLAGDTTTTITHGKTIILTNLVSTGTTNHLAIINSESAGQAASLSTSSSQIYAKYLSIKDSTPVQANVWYAGTNSTSGGNIGNWLLSNPPSIYWIGGTGNWSDASHWSFTSNGIADSDASPVSTSKVYFDSGSCASSCTATINQDYTINGFSLNNSNATIASSGNLTVGGNWTRSAGTFNPGTKTVTFTNSSPALTGATTFNNLTITAPTSITLTGDTVNGELQMTGDVTITGTPTLGSNSTVTYTATSGSRAIKPWTYSTLKINGSSGTFTLPADLTATAINIAAGTLDSNGHNIQVTNWANTGGFTQGVKKVTITGSAASVIGNTTFYDLTIAAGSTAVFAHGTTQTIGGTFTATGSEGNAINLQSDLARSAFTLSKTTGDVSVIYCIIKDSTGSGGANWYARTKDNNQDATGNTGWVFNSPPEFDATFGTNGIDVAQVSDAGTYFGWVKIQYRPYDMDTLDGKPENQGYITPSFAYKSGDGYTGITGQYLAGDTSKEHITATAVGTTTYTAYWDAKSQLPGNYSATMQIQVGADDGETSNHLGTANSATFALDAKAPDISTYTLDAAAKTLTVALSDDNNVSYRVATSVLAEDGTGSPSFTDASAKTYSGALSVDVASTTPTAYFQTKDAFGNITSKTIIGPNGLTNFLMKDTSNVATSDFRQFLSWGVYSDLANATFGHYEIDRASGDPLSVFSALPTIGVKATNYYTDATVLASTPYSYKVRVVDTDGDSSVFSDATVADVPDGQGGSDATAPIIGGVSAAKIYATWAKITWTTDEPANSTVKYSLHQADVEPTYSQTSIVDSYDTAHEVIISGLTPEKTYDFEVLSSDVSTNESTNDNSGAGYQLTTIAGTVISDVAVQSVSDTTATIVWNTSTQTDSHVVYASTGAPLDAKLSTEVLVADVSPLVAGLRSIVIKPVTKFFNWIWNLISSPFIAHADDSTPAPEETPQAPQALDIGSDTIITTAATSGLYQHIVTITGLSPRSTYHFYVKSKDGDGNTAIDTSNSAYYTITTTYDTTPPVISSISTPVVTSSTIIVVWDTDELANGQISYGTTSGSYAESTSLDTLVTINHVATISGLSASTKYYYVIKSADANGNLAISPEQTEDTLASGSVTVNGKTFGITAASGGGGGGGSSNVVMDTTPPAISNIKASSDQPFGAIVSFETNEPTVAFVSYGVSTKYGDTIADSNYGTSHTLKMNNLKMGTTYHLLASAADRSGNIGQSADLTVDTKFVSESLKDLKTFENISQFQDQLENLIQSVLPSLVPPIITEVKVTETTENAATITWKTNTAAYEGIDYTTSDNYSAKAEKSYDQQSSQTVTKSTDHKMTLSNLESSTSYHFSVNAYSLPGVIGHSSDAAFSTKASKASVEMGNVGNTDFQVQWLTKQKTTSVVSYTDNSTGKTEQVTDSGFVQNHAVKVENLTPNTTYLVHVSGYDSDKNLIDGGDLTIKTTRDLFAPVVSNIKINSALLPGQSNLLQTVISWATDEPSTSQVFYDEGVSKSETLSRTVTQDGMAEQHILIVPSLKPSTVYRFMIASTDKAGNITKSPIKTVLTPQQAENVIDVIMKNMQESFGFLQKLGK